MQIHRLFQSTQLSHRLENDVSEAKYIVCDHFDGLGSDAIEIKDFQLSLVIWWRSKLLQVRELDRGYTVCRG